MAKYRCPTLGDCDKANSGEIFEIALGEDLHCPMCHTPLTPLPTTDKSNPTQVKTPVVLIGAVSAVVLMAGLGYYFATKKSNSVLPPPVAEKTEVISSAPPVATPSSPSPMAPPESDAKALRQESANKLASGSAVDAEQASNKALANEMLKSAIAKMAQSKLLDAEKDLLQAKERDPKQSLIAYNLAILRLKQGRKEDAFKEFEASFMAGFSYFDKMDQDPDLEEIRKDPRFADLIKMYRK